jgi:imidazolonepropionase-like amidohydrolase
MLLKDLTVADVADVADVGGVGGVSGISDVGGVGGVGGPRWRRGDIRITDGTIAEIGPGLTASGEPVLACDGRFAVPGLIDAHIHLRAGGHTGPTAEQPVPTGPAATDRAALIRRLHGFLYCGVTSVYDAGNDAAVILPLRQAERAGEIVAPRIFCTGSLLTCPGGHGSGMGLATQIGSLPADAQALADFLRTGPDLVKITYDEHGWGVRPLIPILPQETLRQIIAACHAAGQRVTVHVSSELRAREAVAAGADTLAHPVIQAPVTEEFCRLLADARIPVVSTLAIGDRYPRLADHPDFVDGGLYAACLSPAERAELRTAESARQRQNRWADWMRVMTPVAQENVRRLAAAGGIVVTGTDLSLGADYHRELELLQDAGLGPWDVLRAATVHAAAFLGRAGQLGALAPGYRADLLLLDADPAADVAGLAAIWQVCKAGRLVDRAGLSPVAAPLSSWAE